MANIHIACFSHLNGVTLEHLAASTIANRNVSTSLSHRAKAMKIFNYPDVKTILVCGDIHGNFDGIVHKLCVEYDCMDTLLIVAGDCGFGFE